jgi:hypothetical protein
MAIHLREQSNRASWWRQPGNKRPEPAQIFSYCRPPAAQPLEEQSSIKDQSASTATQQHTKLHICVLHMEEGQPQHLREMPAPATKLQQISHLAILITSKT